MSTLQTKLTKIQQTLKVEKGQYNNFGKYSFRSTEDILEGVKPLLGDLRLTISERMEVLGTNEHSRFYKITTAEISDGKESIQVSSWTREDEKVGGMTHSQLSGSVSSYGTKMALRGLFLIDDTKDADATNTHGKDTEEKKSTPEEKKAAPAPAVSTEKKPAPSFKRPVKQDSGDL